MLVNNNECVDYRPTPLLRGVGALILPSKRFLFLPTDEITFLPPGMFADMDFCTALVWQTINFQFDLLLGGKNVMA